MARPRGNRLAHWAAKKSREFLLFRHEHETAFQMFEAGLVFVSLVLPKAHAAEHLEKGLLFLFLLSRFLHLLLLRLIHTPHAPRAVLRSIPYSVSRLFEPIDPDNAVVVAPNDTALLNEFVSVAHSLVLDRLLFSTSQRKRLYLEWLKGTRQPRLMALKDAEGRVRATSIILPLTSKAYSHIAYNAGDVLDLTSEPLHLRLPSEQYDGATRGTHYYLIDLLANDTSQTLIGPAPDPYGGFHLLFYHLSRLVNPEGQTSVVCCTQVRALRTLLHTLGFLAGSGDSMILDVNIPKHARAEEFRLRLLELIQFYRRHPGLREGHLS